MLSKKSNPFGLFSPFTKGLAISNQTPEEKRNQSMTICIAAICNKDTIIGASDRMITQGDSSYEPPISKIIPITSSIVAMGAGNSSLIDELATKVSRHVKNEKEIDKTWTVEEIVQLWIYYKNKIALRYSENKVLSHFGLTHKDFLEKHISSDLTNRLGQEIFNCKFPLSSEVVISGIDINGPQIFLVLEDNWYCCNNAGFGVVGDGYRHVQTKFILENYSYKNNLSSALLLTYLAKKESKLSPFIGTKTDVFMITKEGKYTLISEDIIKSIDEEYRNIVDLEKKQIEASCKKMDEICKTIFNNTNNS